MFQLAAFSDSLSKRELAVRIEKDVAPELLSIEGVTDVRLDGNQPPVLRVLLDPARMASHRISATEVITSKMNFLSSASLLYRI
ncbi:MAG: efflux RND transporter permease subunit [Oligoflexus sp.]